MGLERITSRENRRLIHARKVRDGRERSQMFIEGRRLAEEAIRSEIIIDEGFVAEGFEGSDILNVLSERGIAISNLPGPLFRSIAATEEPQGIVLLAQRPNNPVDDFNLGGSTLPLFLFLKEVNNPANLGAILRSAEAAGVGGIFVSKNSADVFSPKALRASMGSAFRTRITVNSELTEVLDRARAEGLECLAVDSSGKNNYLQVDWTRPHLLIFGSEAHGISESERNLIGREISIPMENSVESLNLAVAAGVVLFEAKRQILIQGY